MNAKSYLAAILIFLGTPQSLLAGTPLVSIGSETVTRTDLASSNGNELRNLAFLVEHATWLAAGGELGVDLSRKTIEAWAVKNFPEIYSEGAEDEEIMKLEKVLSGIKELVNGSEGKREIFDENLSNYIEKRHWEFFVNKYGSTEGVVQLETMLKKMSLEEEKTRRREEKFNQLKRSYVLEKVKEAICNLEPIEGAIDKQLEGQLLPGYRQDDADSSVSTEDMNMRRNKVNQGIRRHACTVESKKWMSSYYHKNVVVYKDAPDGFEKYLTFR
jgi:hypothetical protein